MKRYLYSYQTAIDFSVPVINHSFLLRCQPMMGDYMNMEEEHLIIPPEFNIRRGNDQFGNRIIYGGQRDPHSSLAYVSVGILSMTPYRVAAKEPVTLFLQPTPLTYISDEHKFPRSGNIAKDASVICHQVYRMMSYVPLVSSMSTTAAEVLETLQGVCQDYAHLMIAMCRVSGIAARYACGFMEGTGETHAWVEVYDGYAWIGFDPTHNRHIEYGYVKLAHGRDASDCPVSRGLYAGNAIEQTLVNVTLKEI